MAERLDAKKDGLNYKTEIELAIYIQNQRHRFTDTQKTAQQIFANQ